MTRVCFTIVHTLLIPRQISWNQFSFACRPRLNQRLNQFHRCFRLFRKKIVFFKAILNCDNNKCWLIVDWLNRLLKDVDLLQDDKFNCQLTACLSCHIYMYRVTRHVVFLIACLCRQKRRELFYPTDKCATKKELQFYTYK